MGRKPSPHGKDRPRTVVLCGSVADIAQRLADANQLSATLSDLLRNEYGLTGALDEKRAALLALTDERKAMQEREAQLAAELDALEERETERKTNLIPALEARLELLYAKLGRLEEAERRLFDPNSLRIKRRQIDETNDQLAEVMQQLKEAGAR
jgi:chromosome segregation ATPase